VTLDSSRDMVTARFLLEQNVDGFAFNQAGRSPLSISIECLPELALFLLKEKSRFEYRWWGNDLFWFSFNGIILPLQNEQPLQVSDQNGDPTTIEQLIIRHERKKLLETPLMLDVIERKWRSFASEQYTARIVKFSAMLTTVFAASVVEPGSVAFQACAVAVLATWGVNLQVQVAKMTPRRGEQEAGRWKERVLGELGPLGFLDVFHLVVLPVVIGLRLGDSIGLLQLADQFGASVAFFGGLLQITLALRLLTYFALFRVLGPLLVTVLAMVSDATRFLSVLGIVILGYANVLLAHPLEPHLRRARRDRLRLQLRQHPLGDGRLARGAARARHAHAAISGDQDRRGGPLLDLPRHCLLRAAQPAHRHLQLRVRARHLQLDLRVALHQARPAARVREGLRAARRPRVLRAARAA